MAVTDVTVLASESLSPPGRRADSASRPRRPQTRTPSLMIHAESRRGTVELPGAGRPQHCSEMYGPVQVSMMSSQKEGSRGRSVSSRSQRNSDTKLWKEDRGCKDIERCRSRVERLSPRRPWHDRRNRSCSSERDWSDWDRYILDINNIARPSHPLRLGLPKPCPFWVKAVPL